MAKAPEDQQFTWTGVGDSFGTAGAMSTGMVRLSVTLSQSATAVQDVLTALRYLIGNTRLERGCLSCSAWADANTIVHYEEEWETEADARRHVRTSGFTSLLAVMETAQEPPLVRFEFVTKVRGLDYVAEVRDNGDGLWS